MTRVVCCLLLLASVAVSQRRLTPAHSARRVALIVGNNAYSWKPLAEAVADAAAVRDVLLRIGFQPDDVFYGENLKRDAFRTLRRRFVESLRPGDLAFVYYSGHGVEALGSNFLIPVDFPLDATEEQAKDDAVSAQDLLESVTAKGAAVRVMVLDACRDNPLRRGRSGSGGLASMSQVSGRGTLVMFAAEAGRVAADSGLFRRQLIAHLSTPGIPADEAFKRVARAVDAESQGKQTPAVYGLLLEDFAFAGAVASSSLEDTYWRPCDLYKGEYCRAYLDRFPEGQYAPLAKVILSRPPVPGPKPDGKPIPEMDRQPGAPAPLSGKTHLKPGARAPAFDVHGIDNRRHSLASYAGKGLVLAFFPAAFTGGCTKEMLSYQATIPQFQKAGFEVLAVSTDALPSLKQWSDTVVHADFVLASDSSRKMAIDYGVLLRVPDGRELANRVTFVIDPSGVILHIEEGSSAIDPHGALAACTRRR